MMMKWSGLGIVLAFFVSGIFLPSCELDPQPDEDNFPIDTTDIGTDTITWLDTLSYFPEFPLDGWERHETILSGFLNAYQPCIIEVHDTVYPYRMWFFGWINDVCNSEVPGCDAIYAARSKDLDIWEVYCNDGEWRIAQSGNSQTSLWQSVLHPSANAPYYDSWHNGDPSVILRNGRYYMAYSSTSMDFGGNVIEGYPSGMMLFVMGAVSNDGIHWTKTSKPLLKSTWDTKYPPDPAPGRIGDFHRPSLMWDKENNKWILYFDYFVSKLAMFGHCQWGMAENTGDFSSGTFEIKNGLETPLLYIYKKEFPNPDVKKIGTGYFAVADPGWWNQASGWASRQICVTTSTNGFSDWKPAYVIPPDADVDANQVPQLFICQREGKWWLYIFYATQIGYRTPVNGIDYTKIGFQPGSYNWCYDQIRYMRQEIK